MNLKLERFHVNRNHIRHLLMTLAAARKFKIPKLNDIHVKMKKFDYPLIEWNPTYKVCTEWIRWFQSFGKD